MFEGDLVFLKMSNITCIRIWGKFFKRANSGYVASPHPVTASQCFNCSFWVVIGFFSI